MNALPFILLFTLLLAPRFVSIIRTAFFVFVSDKTPEASEPSSALKKRILFISLGVYGLLLFITTLWALSIIGHNMMGNTKDALFITFLTGFEVILIVGLTWVLIKRKGLGKISDHILSNEEINDEFDQMSHNLGYYIRICGLVVLIGVLTMVIGVLAYVFFNHTLG